MQGLINPRRMRHRVTVVPLRVSVCLSVTKLMATYLVCESKMWCYKVPYGVPNALFVWISLKTFVLQLQHHLLILSFLTSPEPAIT